MPKWRPLESDVQEEVTSFAESIDLVSVRINVVGRKGWPDYAYGYEGRMCFVEFKKLGETPEPLQLFVHDRLRAHGFSVFVVDNADQGVALLTNWKRQINESINVARLR